MQIGFRYPTMKNARDATRPARLPAGWILVMLAAWMAACHGPAAQPQPAATEAPRVEATPIAEAPVATDSAFARLVARLSEPGGYFDTDNLISNETSYQHVLGALRQRSVQGGAYLGVGPGQNFAYIAQIRPRLAVIIDIRRDNLLQHLFFKALFAEARNRAEYLALLHGKPLPDDPAAWHDAGIEALVGYIDEVEGTPEAAEAARAQVQARIPVLGLPLSETDRATIGRIHGTFIQDGLGLRFTSHGRAPRSYYPTYRDLLLETDLTGRHGSFLAREDDFQFIKTMQAEDRLIPVVGDLGGAHALAAIGQYLAEIGETVSAFYTSNVEFYLMRQGSFDRFVQNVETLPRNDDSVIIRSYFNRFSSGHPQTVPGYASTQLLQTIGSLVEEHARGGYRSYWDLVNTHNLPLR